LSSFVCLRSLLNKTPDIFNHRLVLHTASTEEVHSSGYLSESGKTAEWIHPDKKNQSMVKH